jgi:4-cresol dehydrogenase (hydroxylating)
VADLSEAPTLARAMRHWRELLGEARVLADAATLERFGMCTTGLGVRPAAVLRPASVQELQALVRIANEERAKLYPISGGRNWGYGTASAMVPNCVIVDLSAWKQIEAIDSKLGLFAVQPGVTQADLAQFLEQQGLPFMVPVTGAGPSGSLVGNALERGYGITPVADHFAGVTRVEAVLANGEIYRTLLSELGATDVAHAFKWGVGPYVDGLFAQGAFGIVTRLTLALAPRPRRVQAFLFRLAEDAMLETAVDAVREILQRLPGVVGGVNLMNAYRILAMNVLHPAHNDRSAGMLEGAQAERLFREHRITPWLGLGAIYGTTGIVRAARAEIRSVLSKRGLRPVFVDRRRLRSAAWLGGALQSFGMRRLATLTERLRETLRLLEGHPSEISLPLAYWKAGNPNRQMADPSADGCGLIWYSPLVPMNAERARSYIGFVRDTCLRHRFEPLITLSSLGAQCFDSTVPILFDPGRREEADRARACHEALLEGGCALGFVPYRLGIQSMQFALAHASVSARLISELKRSVDPLGIIAPGRYCP